VLVEAEVARAIENFNKLSDSVDDSEKKTLSLGDALDKLSKKSLIISGVLGGAGIAAVKFAGENEKLKLSLKNMLGSAEEASLVFEDWRKLGTSPGLNVDEVFSLGRAMVNMGKDTQYATSTIEMLGNIAAGTGVSLGEISSSFERTRAMGNLTSRDLVSLQQKGIPIVKELAKVMGTSEESIRQLAANGKIGFDDLERAFQSMTNPGGKFAGMMDELSGTVLEKFSNAADDAKQALAAFGEMLLPIATDILESASSLLQGITNMDEGTKRFVLGMGGVIAISGPAIAAIKGIGAALAFAAANPVTLAIGGVIAATSIVAGLINKQANAYKDLNIEIHKTKSEADNLLQTYADGNTAKKLDEDTTRKLIELYPDLTGEIKAYANTVDDAAAAVKRLTTVEVENAAQKQLEKLRKQYDDLAFASTNYVEKWSALQNAIKSGAESWFVDQKRWDFDIADADLKQAEKKVAETREAINAELAKIGKELGRDLSFVDLSVTITPLVDIENINLPAVTSLKKTWQEWFGEIAKVDPSLFGSSGAKAAELYIENFERTLTAQSNIAEVLEQELDVAGILRSRQSDVQNALVELLSINPEEINKPFEMMDNSIQKLIKEYKKLGEEAKTIEDRMSIEDTLKSLQEEYQTLSDAVQGLTKDKYDLALATMRTAEATDIEIEKAEELIKNIRELSNTTGKEILSFEEMLSKKVAGGLENIFPDLEKQASKAIGNIAAQFAMISFDGLLSGINAIGEAFGKGEASAENLRQAMAEMALQILNQLPNMFLQAGLQLIAQGQWALGLGFIAAAGTSAFIAGGVKGRIEPEENASANAHGNAFNANGIIPYAHGGFFTNQIVNTPTYFRHGGKLGVMGEAGPESIMPLRRMANGDLGVAAQGGGNNTSVIINNYTGAEVHQEEHTDAYGNKDIVITFGQIINNHIGSGKADGSMSRYGIRPVGV